MKNIAEFGTQTEPGELPSHQAVTMMDCMLKGLPKAGRILLVPPDITCYYSYEGVITSYLYHCLNREAKVRTMPVVGTYRAMSRKKQIRSFEEDIPEEIFLYHDRRKDTVPTGTVPGAYCGQVSGGRHTSGIDTETNRCMVDGGFDLILSIGRMTPHEVIGMSNYTKSILMGLGGRPMTNGTHMLDVLCNLKTTMGNTDMPVRAVFDYGEERFLRDMSLAYILTIVLEQEGRIALRGIFTGAPRQVYEHAAALAKRRYITQMERRAKKVMAYLEPEEFSTTWVRSRAIYHTCIMIEDGGELLAVAPEIKEFDESSEVDGLIRHYGYKETPYTVELIENGVFPSSTMVPVHMIHSPSEGRFTITCAINPEYVSQNEIDQIGYELMDVKDTLARYPILETKDE